MDHLPSIALLGYGEAGSHFGRDLVAAGVPVRVYDPEVTPPDAVEVCADEADAVRGVDAVLSVNSTSSAMAALVAALPSLGSDTIWADLNTASPDLKRRLAEVAAEAGVRFADVAIMAPVPGKGLRVPMLASGEAAEDVASLLGDLDTPISVQEGPAGAAAERKLLRSVFFKGIGAAVVEALAAARRAGCEEWLRKNIAAELAEAGPETVERLVTGTNKHARRRYDEMAASVDMLRELGVEPLVSTASRDLLGNLLAEQEQAALPFESPPRLRPS
ncbi:MAG: DUF1932 domain-containing protein [Propionibacteriales bacterium]|nr:DUF1932 domain-containing protein [Propionibacteriales bacterium]